MESGREVHQHDMDTLLLETIQPVAKGLEASTRADSKNVPEAGVVEMVVRVEVAKPDPKLGLVDHSLAMSNTLPSGSANVLQLKSPI